MSNRNETGAKTADAMLAIVAKGLLIWDNVLKQDIQKISAGVDIKKPCISPKDIAVLATAGVRLAQVFRHVDADDTEERRRIIQETIRNPTVRQAMRIIAKETNQFPTGDDDGTLQ